MQSDVGPLFNNLIKKLHALGVSEEQLAGVRFLHPDPSSDFDEWAFTYPPEIAAKAIIHLKDFLALRWVLQDEGSRVVSGAYQHVQGLILAKSYSADLAFKERQAKKGKQPRGLTDDGQSSFDLVSSFCRKPENSDRSANKMWPHLFYFLKEQNLDPIKTSETTLEYSSKNGKAKLAISTFANLVSRARKEKRAKST